MTDKAGHADKPGAGPVHHRRQDMFQVRNRQRLTRRAVGQHGWLKIENPTYSQVEGRQESFTAFRERGSHT
jgi:hypothetical protein